MTSKALYITTSWDDGHPLDMKLAELLARFGLAATFYIPLHNDRPVLSESQIRSLAKDFEIGGHTIHHRDLRAESFDSGRTEIHGCKTALEQITSLPCRSFCFPLGRFRRRHLRQVREAGFTLARTVELMSLDSPRLEDGIAVMPTTIQAVPAGFSAVAKNSLKRGRPGNFLRYARTHKSDWVGTLETLLKEWSNRGGVFHLWGHSWEIEEHSQWQKLERAFSLLAEYKDRAHYVTNGNLENALSGQSRIEQQPTNQYVSARQIPIE